MAFIDILALTGVWPAATPRKSWEGARVLTKVTRGTLVTNAALAPGSYTVMVKAIDTSGNESVNATLFDIVVSNENGIVVQQAEQPRWAGILTDFIKHDVSARLVPDSNDLANVGGFNTFDVFVPNPKSECIYEALEIDLGFDSDNIRVFADMDAALGPSVTTGAADPELFIDHHLAATAYDGFEPWNLGNVDARFVKMRARILTSIGVAYLSKFVPTLDLFERTESGESITIAAGGTTIVFARRFHLIPNVQVTPDGTLALFPVKSAVSPVQFTCNVFNSSGVDVGGTIDYQATGV